MNSECCELLEEVVLKSAFHTAIEEEIAAVEQIAVKVRYPSAAQRRAEERALRRALGKNQKSNRFTRVAAMIVAVLCVSIGMLMLQPTVRASVTNAVMCFFEDHMSISFDGREEDAQYVIGDRTITYIPRGYVLTDTQNRVGTYIHIYTNGDTSLQIIYYSDGVKFAMDTEHSTAKLVQIGDMQGYLVHYTNDDFYSLYWGNEDFTFTVKGILTEKEILKIANGIQKNQR